MICHPRRQLSPKEYNTLQSTYALLKATELRWGQRIRLANHRDHVHARGEAAHELNVNLAEPENKAV
jgi:hypothetical protein